MSNKHEYFLFFTLNGSNFFLQNASNLAEVQRPQPAENIGFKHNVKHRYFPEIVETIVPTKL